MRRADELRRTFLKPSCVRKDDPRLAEATRVERVIFLTAAVCAGSLPFSRSLL